MTFVKTKITELLLLHSKANEQLNKLQLNGYFIWKNYYNYCEDSKLRTILFFK